MSHYPKIDARVMVLEREMPEIRKLASDASREVGDLHGALRGYKRALLSLRETQLDYYADMREGFATTNARFDKVDARFDRMDARFDRQDDKFAMILELLEIMRRESDES